jgi:hypothetical protein
MLSQQGWIGMPLMAIEIGAKGTVSVEASTRDWIGGRLASGLIWRTLAHPERGRNGNAEFCDWQPAAIAVQRGTGPG